MDRDQIRITGKESTQEAWARLGRAVLAWAAASGFVALVWLDLSNRPRPSIWILASQAALHALLAFALARGLEPAALTKKRRYRLAFLLSASLPLVYGGAYAIAWLFAAALGAGSLSTHWVGALRLGVAILGALLGGLAVTGLDDGLWENNSPPSEQICREVHQMHQQRIGVPGPQPWSKRGFDVLVALAGLVFSTPFWMLSICLIWLEDPGPIFFVKNSVGKGGKNFYQLKLRSMVCGAEEHTGPILAQQSDARILFFGRFLRKTALDELPQLVNILLGQMSFVGPRPQRTVLVHGYLQHMPEYAERHRLLPGLAGLAQVAGDYYLTPRQKLRFDRLYIRYSSLGFDIKLLLLACLITFWLRWQKDWNGRLPRRLFRR